LDFRGAPAALPARRSWGLTVSGTPLRWRAGLSDVFRQEREGADGEDNDYGMDPIRNNRFGEAILYAMPRSRIASRKEGKHGPLQLRLAGRLSRVLCALSLLYG